LRSWHTSSKQFRNLIDWSCKKDKTEKIDTPERLAEHHNYNFGLIVLELDGMRYMK
jgi:hypothetical protein